MASRRPRRLDEVVAEAYGWDAEIGEVAALGELLEMNLAQVFSRIGL